MTTTHVNERQITRRSGDPARRALAVSAQPQQPAYQDAWLRDRVCRTLESAPAMIDPGTIDDFAAALVEVAHGRAQVIQAGDCAERPTDCVPDVLERKVAQIHALANTLTLRTGLPTLPVGRIAGQFAKPRSGLVETLDGIDLPVFRGVIVNGATANTRTREHDPLRLLHAFQWASTGSRYLQEQRAHGRPSVWTSHEALVLSYESALIREYAGRRYLTSTHWPWIGDRTRDPCGAHVQLLASVENPVAVKVGPSMNQVDLLAICRTLDPQQRPGRLTLIARFGATQAREMLRPLAEAIQETGHPVIWMCDPLHGNTVKAPSGLKTRAVADAVAELTTFTEVLGDLGVHPGGLHLETTPFHVNECVDHLDTAHAIDGSLYSTLCDPRLNPMQSLQTAAAWGPAATPISADRGED